MAKKISMDLKDAILDAVGSVNKYSHGKKPPPKQKGAPRTLPRPRYERPKPNFKPPPQQKRPPRPRRPKPKTRRPKDMENNG